MELVDKEKIAIFPYLSDSGTEEVLRDIALKNLPEDVFYDNEECLMDMCWDVIEAFINVIKTEPAVKINPEIKHICLNCQYYEPDVNYCEKLECEDVPYNDGCPYWKGSEDKL